MKLFENISLNGDRFGRNKLNQIESKQINGQRIFFGIYMYVYVYNFFLKYLFNTFKLNGKFLDHSVLHVQFKCGKKETNFLFHAGDLNSPNCLTVFKTDDILSKDF